MGKVFACHEDGPPGPLAYWECKWDEKHLGVERDFELLGMVKRRLLRLRPDYNDVGGWLPESREEFMTVVIREALGMNYCEVVGGFLRDWVIRGEVDVANGTPKDIDLRLWKGFDLDVFSHRCERWGLRRNDKNSKIGFNTPSGEWFFVDYIWTEEFERMGNLTIDLDVNSLAVSADLGLHKRAHINRPMCKIYGNIRRKVAYLIKNDPDCVQCDYMKARVQKMEKRGWRVIRAKSLDMNCANKCERPCVNKCEKPCAHKCPPKPPKRNARRRRAKTARPVKTPY